jgi:hypothetical protein
MAQDETEARWEDDGVIPFFVFPIVGMAVGRVAGLVGLLGGALLGFGLAIGIAGLFGKLSKGPRHRGASGKVL